VTPQAGCACQPPVAGEQGCLQRFGEGDVGGVVDCEVVAELPAAGQQGPVGRPPERQGGQVGQGQGRTAQVSRAAVHLPAQHRGDLEIHQFWRAQPFPAQAGAGMIAVRAVIAKGGGQDAGVNDEHDRSAA